MAFGKSKKVDGSSAKTEGPQAESPKAPRKQKESELLSSVVKESVVSSAYARMKSNTRFILPNGVPIIVALPVANIGGLSAKSKGDEAKGSIVELIRTDMISSFVNEPMLAQETLGIIPTDGTVERMGEFGLLKTGDIYIWATVQLDDDGETAVVSPLSPTNFDMVKAVSEGNKSLKDVLSPEAWAWGGGDSEEVAAKTAVVENVVEDDSDEDLDDSFAGEDGVDDFAPEEQEYEVVTVAEVEAEPVTYEAVGSYDEVPSFSEDDDVDSADGGDDSYESYTRNTADADFDESAVRNTLTRQFLSDDLNLIVDVNTFDQIFGSDAEYLTFDPSGATTTWLGDQVQQLTRSANAELSRMRQDHNNALRQRYVTLLSAHAEQVIADLDVTREGSYYGSMLAGATADRDKALDNIDQSAAGRRREIEEEFDKEAKRRGEQARLEAENRFRDRNRPQHLRNLEEVTADTAKVINETYDSAHQTLLRMREITGDTQYEIGHTRVIEILQGQYQDQIAIEQGLMDKWTQDIRSYIESNRKDDVARAEALAEQLGRENTVAKVREEAAIALGQAEDRRSAEIAALEERMLRERQEAILRIEEANKRHDLEIDGERKRTDAAISQSETTTAQSTALMETMRAEFDAHINELRESVATREVDNNRSRRGLMLVGGIAIVAALAAGIVAGVGISSNWFGGEPTEVIISNVE